MLSESFSYPTRRLNSAGTDCPPMEKASCDLGHDLFRRRRVGITHGFIFLCVGDDGSERGHRDFASYLVGHRRTARRP
jgi:hypothetical protein